MPTPAVLGRNGTYVVFRKLHTKVAAYRQYLRDRAATAPKRHFSARRWSGAGPVAHRSHSPRPVTTPNLARTGAATTTSVMPMTRAASNALSEPTPDGPTRVTPSTTTAASTSDSTG